MKIRIKDKQVFGSEEYVKAFELVRGKVVDVDTDFLFDDQYNISNPNLRIMEKDVEEVIDDIRPTLYECKWCGSQFKRTLLTLPSCIRCGSIIISDFNNHYLNKYSYVTNSFSNPKIQQVTNDNKTYILIDVGSIYTFKLSHPLSQKELSILGFKTAKIKKQAFFPFNPKDTFMFLVMDSNLIYGKHFIRCRRDRLMEMML